MNSIDEMNKFLERYKLPILNQEEIENLNRPICSKEIESIKKNLPVKRSPEPDGFTEVLYSLKEESALIFSQLLQNKRKKEYFFIHSVKSPLFPYQIQRCYMERKLQ